jgi:predicted TIM-barrel fold metal-dependent hydrolase
MAFETYHQTFHYIRECGLPPEDVEQILHHNSQRVLGLE